MKRRWIALILALVCMTACAAPEEPSASGDTVQSNGTPDGSATKTVYVRTEATVETGDTQTRTVYVFDEQDQVREVVVYTNGQETRRHSVECDEHGNYIRWTSGQVRVEFTYSQQGEPLGYQTWHGEDLIGASIYTWENGLRTEVIQQLPLQQEEDRVRYTYDAQGRLIRQERYHNGILESYSVYTLGEDGRPVTMSTYLSNGELDQQVEYGYEGLTVTATADDGSYTQEVYDQQGNLLSQTHIAADGTMTDRQTYQWKAIEVPADSLRASI